MAAAMHRSWCRSIVQSCSLPWPDRSPTIAGPAPRRVAISSGSSAEWQRWPASRRHPGAPLTCQAAVTRHWSDIVPDVHRQLLPAATSCVGRHPARSVLHVANALAELDAAGAALYSDQQTIDSTTPMGRAMIQVASVVRTFARPSRRTPQTEQVEQPHCSPFQALRPSRTQMTAITSATAGSSHHRPRKVLAASSGQHRECQHCAKHVLSAFAVGRTGIEFFSDALFGAAEPRAKQQRPAR